ncbi:hypothetical protein REPUB_Repub04eG0169300 [Reevesia pubescens]
MKADSLGIVIRNSSGTVMVSAVAKERFIPSVLYAEMKAILAGVKVALQEGLDQIQVESDHVWRYQKFIKLMNQCGREVVLQWRL